MGRGLKILLINPPRFNIVKWTANDWEIDLAEISSFPPLGLMYIASYIKRHSAYDVMIMDAVAEGMSYEAIGQAIKAYSPDVVGISSFTYTFFDALKTAKLVRALCPSAHIDIGGPHTSLFPEETMTHREFDSLVIGDGEITFKEMIDCIAEGRSFDTVSRDILYRQGGAVIKKQGKRYLKDLDSLPFPAIDLVNYKRYYSPFGRETTMATICTSRGCPFQCTYCQVPDKQYRVRSAKNIIEEMLWYYERGIRFFYFFDDMFNITLQRVIEISEMILNSEMRGHISWLFRGRVDSVNDDMLRVSKMAGCRQILFGVEDYNDEGLKKIKKKITIQQAFEAVRLAKKYGIETSTNWIMGLPNHRSTQDLKELVDTAIRIDSDYAQFSILQLLPGCEMYDEAVAEGILDPNYWKDYVLSPKAQFYVQLYTKCFGAKELSDIYRDAHIRYYRRFGYILKRLLKVRSLKELKVKARAAMAVLR